MSPDSALAFAGSIRELLWVKVGLELFVAGGPDVVRTLKGLGKRIFLDLKFHDIPATMAAACRQAAALGVELMTVHACAGTDALRAAQRGAVEGSTAAGLDAPRLLAVTVLTSWQQQAFQEQLQVQTPIQTYASHLADLAVSAGLGGCVCSPHEVRGLRAGLPDSFAIVTPGIRPAGSAHGDQARITTPADALALGATQLVIGRPITCAADPQGAFAACCQSLNGC
ncbi:orotidine-5'-phosphate decarboxylase [Cyanobium sp. CH-040]|nr:orotidine-5'-phosphate decarboxylase [Cyanobium sp. CH-040]